MTTATLADPSLDLRPLHRPPARAASPWRSPTFWLAWILVMPIALVVRVADRTTAL